MKTINRELKDYIEQQILPIYENNDSGHSIEHIQYVVKRSLRFASQFPNINLDMVYVIASFHDIAHHIDKDNHEVLSAKLFYENEKMNELIWAIEDKKKHEVVGYINASERSEANRICKFKCGIALDLAESGLLEEALKVVINYLLKTGKFDVIISEFFDGCKKLVEAKSRILENVGMVKEAILHKRIINSKTGLAENKIIYSMVQ